MLLHIPGHFGGKCMPFSKLCLGRGASVLFLNRTVSVLSGIDAY